MFATEETINLVPSRRRNAVADREDDCEDDDAEHGADDDLHD